MELIKTVHCVNGRFKCQNWKPEDRKKREQMGSQLLTGIGGGGTGETSAALMNLE
jgi:hypothetical protein